MDCSLPDSSVHGIFQARILEWVAIPFSKGSSWSRKQTQVSCIAADSLLSEPPGKPLYSPLLFSHSVMSTSLRHHGRQASLSFTISQSLLKLMSIESVVSSIHSSSVAPFSSCLQSFLTSGSFPVNKLFVSGGQSIRVSASASVFLINIQDWFPLELMGLISLLSQESSLTLQFKSIHSSAFSILYWPTLTSTYD